jgi:hypothetical protein
VGKEPAQRGQLLFQVQRVEDLRLDHLAGSPVDQVQPAKRCRDREVIRLSWCCEPAWQVLGPGD